MGQAVAERARRTQAERSASTRARLLDATHRVPVRPRLRPHHHARDRAPRGPVARRAAAPLSDQGRAGDRRRRAPLRAPAPASSARRSPGCPAGADRYAAAIDILWSMVSGPTFDAWLELAVAARTDPELRRRRSQELTAHAARADRRETFRELFGAGARRRSVLRRRAAASSSRCSTAWRSSASRAATSARWPGARRPEGARAPGHAAGDPRQPRRTRPCRQPPADCSTPTTQVPEEERGAAGARRAGDLRAAGRAPEPPVGREALRRLRRHPLGRSRVPHRPRRSALGAAGRTTCSAAPTWYRSAAAGRARAHRAPHDRHVHEDRAAVRERAEARAARVRAASCRTARPSSATPTTRSSRRRSTR